AVPDLDHFTYQCDYRTYTSKRMNTERYMQFSSHCFKRSKSFIFINVGEKPMKLKALALGVALAFPMMASAQSSTSVTLYGTVDTAIEYVSGIWDGSEKHSSVHFTNLTQSWPSHWGLRGSEDLGNGLKAVFTLESGFNAGTGTSGQGGRLFGRQAYVGLAGDWGQLAFGRQYNMLMRSMLGAYFLGPNAYGLGSLDNYIPNARMDNSITYMGNFSGFKFGAAWARGRDGSGTYRDSSGNVIPGGSGPANS